MNHGPRGPYDSRWRGQKPDHPLRQARIARRLTQAELSAELGINRSYIAQIESGRKSIAGYNAWSDSARKLNQFIKDNAPAKVRK
jgi:transcriptional regulator with XRE-family HTH domain